MQIINLEFSPMDVEKLLESQDEGTQKAYDQDLHVDAYLRYHPFSVTKEVARGLYMLGVMKGKQIERARRKRGTTNADA